MDVKLYFHANNQFLDLSGRMGYAIYKGQIVQSQITVQDIDQLAFKQLKKISVSTMFGFSPLEEVRKCSHGVYDKCMYSKLSNIMKKETEDKCTVPWVLNTTNICIKSQDVQKAFWIGWKHVTNQEHDCDTPCRTILVNVGAKNQQLENKSHAKLYAYFASHVTQSVEHYYYTILKLVAQIGGYLGLFRVMQFLLDLCGFSRLRPNFRFKHLVECRRSRKDMANEAHLNRSDPVANLSSLALYNI